MIDFRELVKAGVHFGHQASRWVPKMRAYIWGARNKTHIIDVSKTAHHLERAAKFLESVTGEGKQVLWVGTKRPAQDIIHSIATKLDMPFVNHRWIGGTLSNFSQVKKSVTKMLHFQDVLAKSEKFPHYTKKELGEMQKNLERLKTSVGGIQNLSLPLGAIVLVDVAKEASALKEAVVMGVPVVALVDTNGDPSLVDYVIPANDDAPRSIKIIVDYLAQAASKGVDVAAKEKAAAKEEKEKKAAEQKAAEQKKSEKTEAKPKSASKTAAPKAKEVKTEDAPKKTTKKAEAAKPKATSKTSSTATKKTSSETKESATGRGTSKK